MRTKFKNKIPLCGCGCGNPVGWHRIYKRWNTFIHGHQNIGRKFSDRWKRKLSFAFSGESNHNYGKKRSEETKRKISKAHTGKKHSDETILKISGENSTHWKGGASCEPYCANWTQEYKAYIRERDNNECQNPDCWHKCDDTPLHIHHIDYIKKNCALRNLITLCISCNGRANKNRKEHTKFYQEMIEQKYTLKKAA